MPNDDTVGKGGWGGENVSKSDGVILECSLTDNTQEISALSNIASHNLRSQKPPRFLAVRGKGTPLTNNGQCSGGSLLTDLRKGQK